MPHSLGQGGSSWIGTGGRRIRGEKVRRPVGKGSLYRVSGSGLAESDIEGKTPEKRYGFHLSKRELSESSRLKHPTSRARKPLLR